MVLVLENMNQTCWNCNKYLSVGPVMMSSNNKIICGRCHHLIDTTYKTSMYNIVADHLMFNCINNFEGCKTRLFYNEAIEHEKICAGKMYDCLSCSYEGILSQLYEHYKRSHPGMVLQDNVFKVPLYPGYKKTVIHTVSDLFQVFEVLVNDENILVSVICKKPVDVNYDVRMFRFDVNSNFEFIMLKCNDLSNTVINENVVTYKIRLNDIRSYYSDIEWIFCKIQINDVNQSVATNIITLPAKLTNFGKDIVKICEQLNNKLNIFENRLSAMENNLKVVHEKVLNQQELHSILLDSFCQKCDLQIFRPPINFCPSGHILCDDCLKISPYCKMCKKHSQWKIIKFDKPYKACCYDNCSAKLEPSEYLRHIRDCKMRIYKCPLVNCNWTGSLTDLKTHWHCDQPQLLDVDEFNFNLTQNSVIICYCVAYNELFQIIIDNGDSSGRFDVKFNKIDVVAKGEYRYSFSSNFFRQSRRLTFELGHDYGFEIEAIEPTQR